MALRRYEETDQKGQAETRRTQSGRAATECESRERSQGSHRKSQELTGIEDEDENEDEDEKSSQRANNLGYCYRQKQRNAKPRKGAKRHEREALRSKSAGIRRSPDASRRTGPVGCPRLASNLGRCRAED